MAPSTGGCRCSVHRTAIVIGLNYCAIGVENVGSDTALLTKGQLKANESDKDILFINILSNM